MTATAFTATGRSTTERAPIILARNRTANGGWEYWLEVNNRRVGLDTGIFVPYGYEPAKAFTRLLQREMDR